MTNYDEFLKKKSLADVPTGLKNVDDLRFNEKLFDFQRDFVKWALRRGRACIWADCGLGKTAMELEWGKHVFEQTGGNVLTLTTLAVSEQTVNDESPKFGIESFLAESQDQVKPGINVTNYEKLDKFDLSKFAGIILDESSILKNYAGATRNAIIDKAAVVPFRLACTATPAPNDFMEIGSHAEFIGVMKYAEMLAMFFVHDGGDTAKWRLKGHARSDFFAWVASWAVMMRKPSDLGYSDDGFNLPELKMHQITVPTGATCGNLIPMEARTLNERQQARRETIAPRSAVAAKIIEKHKNNDSWCVWCNLNDEADAISKLRPGMVNIKGSDQNHVKAAAMMDFAHGKIDEIVTKPKIAGMGMNWQICGNTIFLGLSDSWEQLYQAIRRFYRFGRKETVNVYIVTADIEGSVLDNIIRKERDADEHTQPDHGDNGRSHGNLPISD